MAERKPKKRAARRGEVPPVVGEDQVVVRRPKAARGAAPAGWLAPDPPVAAEPERVEPRPDVTAVLGAILGVAMPLVLGTLFATAYDAIDRPEPDLDGARRLHTTVAILAGLTVLGGLVLAVRTKPLVAVGLVLFPLGFALESVATSYSHTECVSGFWTSDCDTWGDQGPALRAWAFGTFVIAAAGSALMLLVGRGAALAAALGAGIGLAAAYLTASLRLLPRLADEAARAAESNEPIVHETPGLGLAILLAALVVSAIALRRR